MDKRDIRVGNWVFDTRNYNYEFKVDMEAISCSELFTPIELRDKFLESFHSEEIEGRKVYSREKDTNLIVLEKNDTNWRLSIHTPSTNVETSIRYVHELQNLMNDCHIYWEI